jgi:hypothetical protein
MATQNDVEPTTDEIRQWMRSSVATEIEEGKESELSAPHAPEWQRGVLAWFADHFIHDDPSSLSCADGAGDGGMDIVSVVSTDQHNHVKVFQCSSPSPEHLAAGLLSTKNTKFADDVREFRNNVIGKAKKLRTLNSTASDLLRTINRMREQARSEDDPTGLTIEIQPLTLRVAHPDARRELDELARNAKEDWSSEREDWIVRQVLDAKDLYQQWRRRRGKDTSPDELKLRLFGEVARDHKERGPFLCFIRAMDLVGAYDEWGAGLLDSNLRYALGKSEVNKTIEAELEHLSAVKWFHEKNNGVVIICNNCHVSEGTVRLLCPQIVNGGQTIHSILTVVKDLERIAIEERTDEQRQALAGIKEQLRLSAKIVTISGGNVHKPDQIAIASNTQNKLSERTMRSSTLELSDLRRRFAALPYPWYLITKDGEWSAILRRKNLVQSKTGNHQLPDFRFDGRYRRLENTDLAVAMMAFLGFVSDAKTSKVFKQAYFSILFAHSPCDSAWRTLASKRVEWQGKEFSELFQPQLGPPSLWFLAHCLWSFWKTNTFPESQQFLRACGEAGERDPAFKSAHWKTSGWDLSDETRAHLLQDSNSCYWRENVAKSAYLVLVYQSMRILVHCFGALDDATCLRILRSRQFVDVFEGRSVADLGDFRNGSLSDGPLTALGRILLHSCQLFWERHETKMRVMPSRQQTLLLEEWISKLDSQVDLVLDRLPSRGFRAAIDGPRDSELEVKNAADLFRQVSVSDPGGSSGPS